MRAGSSSAPNPVIDPWYASPREEPAAPRVTRGVGLDDDEPRTPLVGAVAVVARIVLLVSGTPCPTVGRLRQECSSPNSPGEELIELIQAFIPA